MGELRILGRGGDTKVIWDPENDDEIEAAEEQFDNLIDKGFRAFKVKKDGEAGRATKKFDPSAGRIILMPPIVGG